MLFQTILPLFKTILKINGMSFSMSSSVLFYARARRLTIKLLSFCFKFYLQRSVENTHFSNDFHGKNFRFWEKVIFATLSNLIFQRKNPQHNCPLQGHISWKIMVLEIQKFKRCARSSLLFASFTCTLLCLLARALL